MSKYTRDATVAEAFGGAPGSKRRRVDHIWPKNPPGQLWAVKLKVHDVALT